jgi:hypothetical protein
VDPKQNVEEMWDAFRKLVLHPESPPEQVREMRRAFFGGATAVTVAFSQARNVGLPAVHELANDLWDDCIVFNRKVTAGEA